MMMNFDEIVVKESPGLCRCCLSEGCYKDLSTEYTWMNDTEVYADMLLECFDISISQHTDGPNGRNRLICEVCITRLRDACNFKKQVLDAEKKFVDMLARGELQPKVIMYQTTAMKAEDLLETGDDAEVEYLEEDVDYEDDLPLRRPTTAESTEPSVSDVTTDPFKVKSKRGRPKKSTTVKTEKKAKLLKLEDKPRTSTALTKGTKPLESPMSATKRNRLMKRNAILILEHSSVIPFKWHRQNYLCFFCHQTFKDTILLKEHTKSEHERSSIRAAVSYLRRDEKVKIDISDVFCKVDQTKFESLEELVDHIKTAHDIVFSADSSLGVIPYRLDDNFQCAMCNEHFQYFIKLNQHMNEHFGDYICELCGKSFLSQDRLRCHTLSHGARFHCNVCPETFDSLTQKNNHESRIHQKDKTLKCLYCSDTFANYSQRKRHHHSAHNIEMAEYQCPVCGKTFQIMSKMKVHVKEVHVREKNFACSMCDQKFFSKTHVQKHMVKHFGERIHQCSVCKKSYARKQTLRDHMRIHNNDNRFICAVCSQGFVQNNSLRLHMRVHHSDAV